MAFGTPTANAAAAQVNAASTMNLSIAAVTSGRIVWVWANARRDTSSPASDITISDTAGWTWNQIWAPGALPLSSTANPTYICQGFWAVTNGSANTVTISATNASRMTGQGVDFSIGAGMTIDATNQAFGIAANSTTSTPVVTLGSVPAAADLGMGQTCGAGGSAPATPTGFTSIGSASSLGAYRAFYDTTSPAQTATNPTAGFPACIIAYVALKEVAAGGGKAIPPGLLQRRPILPITRW